jgi:Ca-activated chloride channel family protein
MVSIVTYAGATEVVLEPTPASRASKIVRAIDGLSTGGGTAGGAGLQLAYDTAEENYSKSAVNRIILLTDGDFNVGVSDPRELGRFVTDKRKTGIYLSVIGFGTGNLNDRLMQRIAQMGNGNAGYVDSLHEARKVMSDELNRNLYPIADDVKFQVEFNPAKVAEYRLVGFETRMLRRQDFKNDRVDAGEIGSGHTVTAIFEITPTESAARRLEHLRYQSADDTAQPATGRADEYAYVSVRYKKPGEDESRLLGQAVTERQTFAALADAPEDLRFAVAVAGFGQMLRDKTQVDTAFDYDAVLDLARDARGVDPFGYRSEFLQLVRLAQVMN